jgi:cysteine desulfurase / selenocysteine lyase
MTSVDELRDRFGTLRRIEFPGLGASHYLNAASLAPLPERARSAMERYNAKRSAVQEMVEADFLLPPRLARERAARLIGASAEEIALGGNTSFGINLAAAGLDVPPGSTVLVTDREFPANVYPWMAQRRLRLELVPANPQGQPDEEAILARLEHDDVSIVSVSSVQFTDGYVLDLDRIGHACRSRGAFLVVDAIQSLGVLPLDVSRTPVDVVAVGAHKWLCGPLGAGFAYVRREVQPKLEPTSIGWSSFAAAQDLGALLDYDFRFLPDARRYEVATQPLQEYLGFAESLDLILEAGVDAIAAFVDHLLAPLRAWLAEQAEIEAVSSAGPGRRSGIVSFRTPDLPGTFRALAAGGVNCSRREGVIRVAAHFYNTEADTGRVLEILDGRMRRGWS